MFAEGNKNTETFYIFRLLLKIKFPFSSCADGRQESASVRALGLLPGQLPLRRRGDQARAPGPRRRLPRRPPLLKREDADVLERCWLFNAAFLVSNWCCVVHGTTQNVQCYNIMILSTTVPTHTWCLIVLDSA